MVALLWHKRGAIQMNPSQAFELLKGRRFYKLAFVACHGLDGDPLAAGEEVGRHCLLQIF